MDFNFSKFVENIEKKDVSKKGYKDRTGFNKCASAVWNHMAIDEVDFDSFSYQDICDLLIDIETMLLTPTFGEDEDETYVMDPNCAFMQLSNIQAVVSTLYKSKNRTFYEDEDMLFI